MKRLAAAIGLLLILWGTSCAHRSQRHQAANRTEETSATWQTAETAEDKQQQTAAVAKKRRKVREKFRPDGTLASRTTTETDTAGTWGSVVSRSSSASTAGSAESKTEASSSSSTATSTETRLPWFRIGLGIVVAALLVFCYFRFRAKWTAWFRKRLHI